MKPTREEQIIKETAKQLKALRLAKGISHEVLSRKTGVSRPAISHIENGKRKPSLLLAIKIFDALGTSLADTLSEIEKKLP